MALFPRLAAGEFAPLFRMLDDYATHQMSRLPSAGSPSSIMGSSAFQPRFDIKEHKDAYELHGELPGVTQKDVEIEFTDAQTLKISGRTERRMEIGQRPGAGAAITSGSSASAPGASEGSSEQNPSADSKAQGGTAHQPSVEDETAGNSTSTPAPASGSDQAETTVAKTTAAGQQDIQQHPAQQSRYWLSERTVGQFQRTFAFPDRVDSERVRASLKDGILSVIVPKAEGSGKRKINIE